MALNRVKLLNGWTITPFSQKKIRVQNCFSFSQIKHIMPTSIKAALKKWEEATGKKAAEAK